MRKRAKPSPPPAPAPAPPAAAPDPPAPKKRTKSDELVEVLADGLFDVITDGDLLPSPRDRSRAADRRGPSSR